MNACLWQVSQRNTYRHGEEFTASYGGDFRRTYSAYGFDTPGSQLAPADRFSAEVLRSAKWPIRVPGWWNPDMQPKHRLALTRRDRCVSVGGGTDERRFIHGGLRIGLPDRRTMTNVCCHRMRVHSSSPGRHDSPRSEASPVDVDEEWNEEHGDEELWDEELWDCIDADSSDDPASATVSLSRMSSTGTQYPNPAGEEIVLRRARPAQNSDGTIARYIDTLVAFRLALRNASTCTMRGTYR